MNQMSPTSIADWIHFCEQMHSKEIDFDGDRLQIIFSRLAIQLSAPVFTVAGTNGKGSTCAMLESILMHAGFRTGLYSSPHLVRFNERLRLNGKDVSDEKLLPSFERVEKARHFEGQASISLSFFEFTTLVMLDVMASEQLDAIILEVGMGGRLDAINIVDADCTIITSIDLDHQAYLGVDRESIGFEKAGVMRSGKVAVVSDPAPPKSVVSHAEVIGADLWLSGKDFFIQGDERQWSWCACAPRGGRHYAGLAFPALRGSNQLINAAGVLAALTAMRDRLPVTAQAIRMGLATVKLPARFQIIPGRPLLILDVAHNPHAAAVLAQNLDSMGFAQATHVVMGVMADKDIEGILKKINPLVDHWYFTDLPTDRAASATDIETIWKTNLFRASVTTATYSDPVTALTAVMQKVKPDDRIVVFGSFHTVGKILERGVEQFLPPTL
jgi:dihydrofolate synthase / folylpolyglutamate synthase